MKDFLNISDKPYLLDPNIQSEDTLEVYKSFAQIISENLTWILIFFLVIGILLSLAYLKNKKNKIHDLEPLEPQIDPYDEALEAIKELQTKKAHIQPKPFVFRLSEILRIYIQKRFNMPAMELTGEEFIIEIVSNPFFSGNYEELLRDFVNLGDRVKYSKETTETSQINLLLDSALYFVKDSHNRLKAQENSTQDKAVIINN